jgi:CspA family cold shock protein
MIGAVRSYDSRRGAGLLTPDKGGEDIAVFVSEVERAGLATLTEGQRLTFDVRTDRLRRRSFAVNLELLAVA